MEKKRDNPVLINRPREPYVNKQMSHSNNHFFDTFLEKPF